MAIWFSRYFFTNLHLFSQVYLRKTLRFTAGNCQLLVKCLSYHQTNWLLDRVINTYPRVKSLHTRHSKIPIILCTMVFRSDVLIFSHIIRFAFSTLQNQCPSEFHSLRVSMHSGKPGLCFGRLLEQPTLNVQIIHLISFLSSDFFYLPLSLGDDCYLFSLMFLIEI